MEKETVEGWRISSLEPQKIKDTEDVYDLIISYNNGYKTRITIVGEESVRELIEELKCIKTLVSKHSLKIATAETMVSKYFDVSIPDLKKKTRLAKYTKPRQICAAIKLFYKEDETLAEIGDSYGIDHATVLHAKKVVKNLIETKEKKYGLKFIYILKELHIFKAFCKMFEIDIDEESIPMEISEGFLRTIE